MIILALLLCCSVQNGLSQEPTLPTVTEYYLKNYKFTTDWFTNRIPLWEKILAPLKGKQGIHYLEIGVFEGRSAIWMLENILTVFPGRVWQLANPGINSEIII